MSSVAVSRYQQNHILTASPGVLLLRLYDGALRFCNAAQNAIANDDAAAKGHAIGRALAIVGELDSTLDHSRAPEMCANLSRLYGYLADRLAHASAQMDPDAVQEVIDHLTGLREAWAEAVQNAPPVAVAGGGR